MPELTDKNSIKLLELVKTSVTEYGLTEGTMTIADYVTDIVDSMTEYSPIAHDLLDEIRESLT